MGVTVNPIKTINVRVNSQSPQRVASTSAFYGSSNVVAQANAALTLAQNAFDAANTKVSKSGDTMTGSLTINGNISANNANFNTTVTKIDGGTFS